MPGTVISLAKYSVPFGFGLSLQPWAEIAYRGYQNKGKAKYAHKKFEIATFHPLLLRDCHVIFGSYQFNTIEDYFIKTVIFKVSHCVCQCVG